MAKATPRVELLQGTLDLLILRTLIFGPSHGHAIAQRIRAVSEDVLRVETGSLYPALHRLEAQGLIDASWDISDKGKRAKYYALTPAGRARLKVETANWKRYAAAVFAALEAPALPRG